MGTLKFTVMTWNVENLFLPGGDSGPADRDIYDRKMGNIVQTISGISPDVVGLQEVGDLAALNDLRDRLGGRYRFVRASRFPDPRGIRVAFLSRLPLLQAVDYDDYPPNALINIPDEHGRIMRDMGRGGLKCMVALAPGLMVNMVNCHLKSKLVTYKTLSGAARHYPLDEDERARGMALALIKRTTEAVALRIHLNKLLTGNNFPLILMGDMNDSGDAVTTQILMGPPDRSLAHRDKFDDVRLYNLDDYIPGERRFSRVYQKMGEMIDHIMVSHELIFYLRKADSYIEPISSIDSNVASRGEAVFPDHAPVYARFEIPEDEADRHFSVTG
ncbi:MAG TPA: endonuclease/exonuclease/phosphatase family protein [Aggregatilineales bacterium]|nr:endonuclease/exonuclease/phosphatase family protein [Anaerolineales bacterium]HRE47462.1 endonuclease/exonuclease/phosphatase family protein [Aggregatilineales bacterium]